MTGLFTDVRRLKPLSAALVGELLSPVAGQIARLDEENFKDRSDEAVVAQLLEAYWQPPMLGAVTVEMAGQGAPHPRQRGEKPTTFVPSVRFSLRWEICGRAEWLDYWPDHGQDAVSLKAIDEIFLPPDLHREADRADWNRLSELSSNLYQRQGSAVTSFVEVPRSEEADPQAIREQRVAERTQMLAGYLDAVLKTAAGVQEEAAARLRYLVERRRSDLRWQREVRQGLDITEGSQIEAAGADPGSVSQEMFGMIRESYNGFRIDHEPSADAARAYRDHSFEASPADRPNQGAFSVRMRVHFSYALRELPAVQPGEAASKLARELGLRWVHGLVDTERYDLGRTYDLERTEAWEPNFSETDLDDELLRVELLTALRRLEMKQGTTTTVLQLDIPGCTDIWGVSLSRVRGLIRLLVTERLVEPYLETYGCVAEDGCCRITGQGLRALRAETDAGALKVIYVDDIDSFSRVTDVPAREVASELVGGLLSVPESRVKERFREILGENFEHKDWGGERSDVFSTQLRYRGRRVTAAFLLKGPGTRRNTMYPRDLGKRGDQDLRLFAEPAELFVVQFNGKIDSSVHSRVRATAQAYAPKDRPTLLCFIDGTDTARILKAYAKRGDANG